MRKLVESYGKYIGILIIAVLFAPLLILFIRDGAGGAVFEVHDQLDETILNYYFTARNFGADSFSQMMCGIPSVGLKPFCPIFVPLYAVFNIYHAFLLQYLIVLVTSFYGTYFCVKKLTDNDLSALLSGSLFAALPVHAIYGNVV
ncbi:MAG: DUF6044 family protein, partial [Lachnospiraceae bacterium]|nr:DUF6044 family protein [Lachnospiraceae bacterium]